MSVTADPRTTIDALRARLRGEIVGPDDRSYDEVRRVWNGVIDRRPAVIARCADTADVVAALAVAREHGVDLSVRGGGHQVAGTAIVEDGLVIDLSAMTNVHVDPERRTAQVSAGARWADVDRATQLFGLATPGGEVSVTGVAGLTLGGGMGVLQRAFGLACDNVRSIEIVTADGVVRTASATEHADLFWAARGAGRGIGIVTSFEFELHPLGPEVANAFVIYPADQARTVARNWRDFAVDAPESVSPELLFWNVPPDPDLPEELHLQRALIVIGLHAGDPTDGDRVLAPLAELGDPLVAAIDVTPYTDVQSSADAMFPDGGRYYFKSQFADALSDDALDALVDADDRRPTTFSLIGVRTLGGAIDRVGPDETAYPHRGAAFNVSFDAVWDERADDDAAIAWARSAFSAFGPFSTGGVYVNFAGFEGEDDVDVEDVFGTDRRLAEVRATYDPDGLFRAAAARW